MLIKSFDFIVIFEALVLKSGVAGNVRKQDSITFNMAKYHSKQPQSKVASY